MQVDYALILSAGFGTRMGDVGKQLPKPLWPIFEKNLLELQIEFAIKCGAEKVFINTHHCHELFEKYSASVEILFEPIILGSGGAIHNFANNVSREGTLLTLNSDVFYFVNEGVWTEAKQALSECGKVLFGLPVNKDQGYNQVIIDELGHMKGIQKDREQLPENYLTFSGMGIFKLEELSHSEGLSSFFHTVADYDSHNVKVVSPSDNDFEYWDFGTVELYTESLWKIHNCFVENRTSYMKSFLTDNNCFDVNKFSRSGYNGSGKTLNFSKYNASGEQLIVLDSYEDVACSDLLYWKGISIPHPLSHQ